MGEKEHVTINDVSAIKNEEHAEVLVEKFEQHLMGRLEG
jgi:hypothetical protein